LLGLIFKLLLCRNRVDGHLKHHLLFIELLVIVGFRIAGFEVDPSGFCTMDKKAVDVARTEYTRAVENAALIRTANDFAKIENAWAAFLVAAGRVYTKLEQGSKISAKSKAWWGKKLHERRTDPLLCYVWHARNADEHTLQQITERQDTSVKFVEPTEQDDGALHEAMKGETRPWVPLALTEIVWAHVKFLDVIDRGVRYSAPQTHLGVEITDTSPANMAGMVLAYLEVMLKEADQLTT
jgi:hypothetical protein